MTTTKKGVSSKEIQRLLGLKRYEPVWAMYVNIADYVALYISEKSNEKTTKETLK